VVDWPQEKNIFSNNRNEIFNTSIVTRGLSAYNRRLEEKEKRENE